MIERVENIQLQDVYIIVAVISDEKFTY